jgi:hypothetical protein
LYFYWFFITNNEIQFRLVYDKFPSSLTDLVAKFGLDVISIARLYNLGNNIISNIIYQKHKFGPAQMQTISNVGGYQKTDDEIIKRIN